MEDLLNNRGFDYFYGMLGGGHDYFRIDLTRPVKEAYLPDDVSEANDLLALDPQRARDLYTKWAEWNESNVPCRLMGYIDYHKKRDQFFSEAVPEAALESGYDSTVKGNFR